MATWVPWFARVTVALLGALAVATAGSTSAGAKARGGARAPVSVMLRLRVSTEAGAAAAAARLPGEQLQAEGDELVLGPLAEAGAWTRAVDLLATQPWSKAGVVSDHVRVVAPAVAPAPARDARQPTAAELARWTGGRVARRLVARASGYAFPDFAMPPAAEEIANLAPPVKGKAPGAVLVVAEREVCDPGGRDCLAWLRVLAPVTAAPGSFELVWVPLGQLWIPDSALFQLRRLGRSPDGVVYDVISRRGARTHCVVPDGAPPAARAVRSGRARRGDKDTAALEDASGNPTGRCEDEALSPPR
ncbi:MAG: hypothetical protein IT370_21670 [Deltaproteobacteria bacterium]|nr:hypothetical protein [Deltaproteobacteria bacterium]